MLLDVFFAWITGSFLTVALWCLMLGVSSRGAIPESPGQRWRRTRRP